MEDKLNQKLHKEFKENVTVIFYCLCLKCVHYFVKYDIAQVLFKFTRIFSYKKDLYGISIRLFYILCVFI